MLQRDILQAGTLYIKSQGESAQDKITTTSVPATTSSELDGRYECLPIPKMDSLEAGIIISEEESAIPIAKDQLAKTNRVQKNHIKQMDDNKRINDNVDKTA